MFGETAAKLLLYLAPIEAADLVAYGYTTAELENLLAEKAEIVFSYMPRRYRAFYRRRVFRLLVIPFAYEGQIIVASPFPSVSNALGYLNPTGEIDDLKDAENIDITVNLSQVRFEFDALSLGDQVVIDFDNNMSSFEVLPLIWATNVLAAIDVMAIISGETRTGQLIPRIKADSDRIFPWLEALNSPNLEDRVIIKSLELDFWEGKPKTFGQNINFLMNEAIKGITA